MCLSLSHLAVSCRHGMAVFLRKFEDLRTSKCQTMLIRFGGICE